MPKIESLWFAKVRENRKEKSLGAWRNGIASGFDPDMWRFDSFRFCCSWQTKKSTL